MSDLNPDSDCRIEALFFEALDIEAGEDRIRFLSEVCGDDKELRAELEILLANSEAAEELLDPDRYDGLAKERDDLARELAEENRFLNELGHGVRRFGDDYELLEELGRGASGVVFRAYQISLKREVAIKILLGSAIASPTERERFLIEAEATAALKHPNILPIYEVGRHHHYDFYSMALLSGGTLGQRIASDRMNRRDAVGLILKVVRTVQAAHQRGIIHRDLKPDNILLDESGEPHISDFGLAYRLEQQNTLTLLGQIAGTPRYMAPEQIDPSLGSITTAVDIYSLGVILYELLSGEPPLCADSVLGTMQMVRDTQPKSLRTQTPTIDRDLETIVMKCLEKDPTQRYPTANALADDLNAWLDCRPIAARAPSSTERAIKWVRRRPVHASLGGMAVLLLLTHVIAAPLTLLEQVDLRGQAERAWQAAEIERQAALEAKANADRIAMQYRMLGYSYSERLADAIGRTDRYFLLGASRPPSPLLVQQGLRRCEWCRKFAEVYDKPIPLQDEPGAD
ncbi:serine/threonine protein kinase [Poriferisphaera sp. WC338]|uniref:serine/threonine protein kinase n=1 Tax=Poriferisphaera sp. WC338 TaxID=3425129 RepID=UPI003D819647